LFSWQAVKDWANELCPYPWRVPTQQDFIDLDRALGGTGFNRTRPPATPAPARAAHDRVWNNYTNVWGATYAGFCTMHGELVGQDSWGVVYWSSTESNAVNASALRIDNTAARTINPREPLNKSNGRTVRCVRNL
jgi:uncharacterized protein (TIGR02145 family)